MMQELNQECAEMYYNRGLAHSKKGEVELAIKNYTKAIELKPDYADAYYNRGGAFLRLGEREKAKSEAAPSSQSIFPKIACRSDPSKTNKKPKTTHL